jgi:formaldehyde dismutase / methanol dehydrogenase
MNKEMAQFPIIYSDPIGKYAIGWGAHQTIANECHNANIKKALITTTGLKGTGIVDEIKQMMIYGGVSVEVYDKITSNPKDYQIEEAYRMFKEAQCDGVVSIGGGSSHDCGKGVRALAANGGRPIGDFVVFIDPPWHETMKGFKPVTVPQITINTTAGTGAELTPAGVFTDTRRKAKFLFVLPGSGPSLAIIDPLLVRLMPQNIAAQSGFDAFTHGYESYMSRLQVQHSKGMGLRVAKLVAENLREFAYNRMNHKACEMMCWAANMGGYCMSLGAGGGLVHGYGHQIGAITDYHHGLINAVLAVPVERYNEPSCPERFAELAAAMGVDTRGMTTLEAADKWIDEIERLLHDLGIKIGHLNEQFGLEKKYSKHIVDIYANDFAREGNPKDFNYDEVVNLLESLI